MNQGPLPDQLRYRVNTSRQRLVGIRNLSRHCTIVTSIALHGAAYRYYSESQRAEDTMLAREIMTRDPIWVLPSDPIWQAAEMMRYHGIGCTPVVADEASRKVVGLLTDRDITTRCVARKHAGTCRVADHMTSTPIHVVLTTDDETHVMRKMEAARVRRVPVLSADGSLTGIISQGDVLRHLGHRDPVAFERAMEHVYAGSTFVR